MRSDLFKGHLKAFIVKLAKCSIDRALQFLDAVSKMKFLREAIISAIALQMSSTRGSL